MRDSQPAAAFSPRAVALISTRTFRYCQWLQLRSSWGMPGSRQITSPGFSSVWRTRGHAEGSSGRAKRLIRRRSPPSPTLPRKRSQAGEAVDRVRGSDWFGERGLALEKRERADFDALTQSRVGGRGRILERGVRGPAGAAVLRRIVDLEHQRLLAPHARQIVPAVLGIVVHGVGWPDSLRLAPFAYYEIA